MNSTPAPKSPPKPPHIKLHAVKSSAIKAVGHDPATNTLRIEFLSGGVYDYSGVSADEHAELMSAESHGKHFHRNLRGKGFTKLPAAA